MLYNVNDRKIIELPFSASLADLSGYRGYYFELVNAANKVIFTSSFKQYQNRLPLTANYAKLYGSYDEGKWPCSLGLKTSVATVSMTTPQFDGGSTTCSYKINGILQNSIISLVNSYINLEAVTPQGFIFYKWSDGNMSNPRNYTIPSTINLYAIFKSIQHSSKLDAFSNNSQRKVVYTSNGYYHLVYESMGAIWYEVSANGTTWQLANNGKPLSTNGSLPSIDCDRDLNKVLIVWVENRSTIMMGAFTPNGVLWNSVPPMIVYNLGFSDPYDLNPVVAFDSDNRILVCWILKNISSNTNGIYYWYGSNDQTGTFIQQNPSSVPIISCTPVNLSISGNKDYLNWYCNNTYEFAYEENNQIKYCQLFRNDNLYPNPIVISHKNDCIISNNDGYTQNNKPSIVAVTQTVNLNGQNVLASGARLTWIGLRTQPYPPYTTQKSVFKDPSSLNLVWSFGSGIIQNTSINRTPNVYSIVWASSNPDAIQFTDSHTLSHITTLTNLTGKDVQLSNGNNDYQMRAISFNNNVAPFYFNNQNLYNLAKQNSDQIAINNGREGIIRKDDCQFYFSVGDIKSDNKIVEFTPVKDSTRLQSLDDLNNYLVTNPIQVNNNSQMFYSVEYGISDSLSAIKALKGNSFIIFKVEILDAVTNEVLGVFDNVTYDSLHAYNYDNVSYQLNMDGIGSRTIKLRLKVSTNSDIEYSLKSVYATEDVLLKRRTKNTVVTLLTKVNNFDLSQNFPNPFNPTTTIKYQITKAGMVTLKIYDILGKEVANLVKEFQNSGRYSVNFDASNLASGVYIYRISSNEYVLSKKMMLLK